METESSFARDFGQTIFNFGLGLLLIELSSIPTWAEYGLTGMVVILGILAVIKYGAFIHFWSFAMSNYDVFKPGGDHNKAAVTMLNHTSNAVYTYRHQELFWIAVASNIVFMAGLLQHNLWVAFIAEALAFVVGFSMIRSFLSNFSTYFKLATGKEVRDA